MLTGIFILSIGVIWVLQKAQVLQFPAYIFSWKTLLIATGVVIGIQSKCRGFAWLVFIIVGSFFMLGDIPGIPFNAKEYALPFIILTLGLWIVVTALGRKKMFGHYEDWQNRKGIISNSEADDKVDLTAVFGGNKKKVLSKSFRGGEVVNVFGGTELDLSQADITGTVVIDSTNIFGGMKIVAPSNWNIQIDATCIMGGIEDKREIKEQETTDKKLIITGFCFCGGMEIKSF